MTAFTITVTHPDGTRQTRSFPAAYSAEAALRWATMLRDGYTADTTEAKAAAAMVPQLRRAEAERKKNKK